MTETKINSFKKGTRCQICTGCGRCFSDKPMTVVNSFFATNADGQQMPANVEAVCVTEKKYIIAADIGTTTIAMQLRRSEDGAVLDSFSALNPQRQYGVDVLSRIEAAADEHIKKAMQDVVREVLLQGVNQFASLVAEATGTLNEGSRQAEEQDLDILSVEAVCKFCKLVIAANTTMIHLLMGLDVSRLGQYPFKPETLSEIRTDLFGIEAIVLPGISAFIGGDIVADMEALSIHRKKEIALLLDLGTNGEMVLGNCDRLIATATAAGPAFESATDGYGADLLTLTARLLQEGILDETGLLADPYFEQGIAIGGVHITQQYIRQLQTAKAAVCTGIVTLCKKYGLKSFSEIDKVYLAGGMGYFLSPEAALAVGLLPQEIADKAMAVGNAALEGAFCYGRNAEWTENDEKTTPCKNGVTPHRRIIENKRLSCEVYNLAEEREFAESYIANMVLVPYQGSI